MLYLPSLILLAFCGSVSGMSRLFLQTHLRSRYSIEIASNNSSTGTISDVPCTSDVKGCELEEETLHSSPAPTNLDPVPAPIPLTSTFDGTTPLVAPEPSDGMVTLFPTTVSFTPVTLLTTGTVDSVFTTPQPEPPESESNGDDTVPSDGNTGDGSLPNPTLETELPEPSPSPIETIVTLGSDNTITVSANSGSGSGSGNDGGGGGGGTVIVVDGTTLSQGQIATVGSETLSALPDASGVAIAQNGQTTTISLVDASAAESLEYGVAVITLGDGSSVTATSSDAADGSPVIVLGYQTLTAGDVITTGSVVLSVGTGGVVLSGVGSASSDVAGAIITVGSTTITAIESVNQQGSTVVAVGETTATVDGAPVTLPGGELFSAGHSGFILVGAGTTSSVSYSAIVDSSAPPAEVSPTGTVLTLGPLTAGQSTTATTMSSKRGDSSKTIVNMTSLLVVSFFVVLWAL